MPSRSSFVGFNVASDVDDAEIVVVAFFREEAGCGALALLCWLDCFLLAISEGVFFIDNGSTSFVLVFVTNGSVFIVDCVWVVSYGGGSFTGG